MTKKEWKALRRPFLRELFRKNKFNLVMTVVAAFLAAASELVISWTIKGISDLISGDTAISFHTLLLVAIAGFGLMLLAWALDRTFLSAFRARAMQQYRKYAFDRLLEKGIQAFSGENSARYLSALSNDANTIEQDYLRLLQSTVEVSIIQVIKMLLPVVKLNPVVGRSNPEKVSQHHKQICRIVKYRGAVL